ncbi:related to SEC8 - protein transport protein [Pseudozyma flocculosa]|nr:related to SEC8 - protein transport protein [Pseudozyma flocculosa]
MSRHNTIKDLRSRIKHENTSLGSGTAHHVADVFNPTIHGSANVSGNGHTRQAPSNVGAGPSFVSLAPSDSISQIDGKTGYGGGYSETPQGYPLVGIPRAGSPTNQSTASFALMNHTSAAAAASAIGRPSSPLRPARSVRRPQQAPAVDGLERSSTLARPSLRIIPGVDAAMSQQQQQQPSPPPTSATRPHAGPGRDLLSASRSQQQLPPPTSVQSAHPLQQHHQPADRHARSAQLMAQVALSANDRDGGISSGDEDDIYGGISPIDPPENGFFGSNGGGSGNRLSVPGGNNGATPAATKRQSGAPLGSLTHADEPAALGTVLAALSAAGRKHQAARIMRGTTAEEETRRRKTEKKISDVQAAERRPLGDYVKHSDERGFQDINAVLRKVKAEWPFVADDDFNSVALALSMLDESSLGASRHDFESMKGLIETSLQGTVDDHYESFATAITLHNSVLLALTAAQNSVSGARRRLRDSREALGAKRADLVQMWQRSQAVKESLRLLDVVEHLKGVPDRLENLMAEKRFLQAVNLLVRSLKTIDKPEIVEVGATSDLRAYLKGQEQAMLEILIEELHNHLYLKSYFCDARWKSYAVGQEALPAVDFGVAYSTARGTDGDHSEQPSPNLDGSGQDGQSKRPLKLSRYLQTLGARPAFDPNLASNIQDVGLTASASLSALTGEIATGANGLGMPSSYSVDSNVKVAGDSFGVDVGAAEFDQNPEADSFLYIEMLLESLARLGKLGTALDTVSQRLPIEVHQLVDATIDEVDARNEPMRRFSVALRPESVLLASSSALAKSFSESFRASRSSFNMGNRPVSSMLRISAGESSALQREGETMRDLFWTLFSKLDAVLQGHRVVYEVAGMIAGRSGFKDELASKRVSGVASLVEVWKPIQTEVRTLLHDYLMDDEQSSSSRNAIVSVNDVLRSGRFGRDRSKQLFKLTDSGLKTGKRQSGVLRRHEDALTAALRASVPGLVSSLDAANAAGSTIGGGASAAPARANQTIVSSTRQDESYAGGGHRLLVKPDAFNVSVLFQPALAFIERVQAVLPSEAAGETSRGFSAFLEEFVQDVFLPQLEDKVQSLFQNATGGADAFQEDPASRRTATRPVVKSVTNIIVLIDSLYSMLRTTPFHRESYSRLIITTIVQYYQRCGERFRDLVAVDASSASIPSATSSSSATSAGARDGSSYTLSAAWAQRPELYSCLVDMLQPAKVEADRLSELQAQENRFEMALARSGPPIGFHDMTTSRKKLLALGHLQHSLQWFLSNLSRLKAADEDVPRAKRPQARLSVIDSVPRTDEAAAEELKLPLSKDMAARYEALPNVYRHLSNVILFTLRIELRVRVLYHLGQAVSEGNYVLNDDTAIEPSPHVVDLNAEMAHLDDIFSDTLTPDNRRFVFTGLSSLMSALLIQSVQHLRAINRAGVTKMIRNILALQQNLKNIVEMPLEVSFERCRKFWELLSCDSPQAFFAAIRQTPDEHKQGFDVYKAALLLMLGLDNPPPVLPGQQQQQQAAPATPGLGPAVAQKGAGTIARKSGVDGEISRQDFNEYLIELHEVAAEQSDDGL